MAHKTPPGDPALQTWIALNDALRDADEAACERLLRKEMRGRRRKRFVLRIHSRLNRVRAHAERQRLLKG